MPWRELLVSATVQMALLAVLVFLARTILGQWLTKDLEQFKAGLSAVAQRELEQYRAALSLDAQEHQVRFEAQHAKRLDAIGSIYAKLVAARYTMQPFVSAWRTAEPEEFQKVAREFWELRREVDSKRAYLPEALGDEISACIKVMWSSAVAAKVWPGVANADQREHAEAAFTSAQTAVLEGGAVDQAIAQLERQFRKVLEGAG